jgi:hypothetical protein
MHMVCANLLGVLGTTADNSTYHHRGAWKSTESIVEHARYVQTTAILNLVHICIHDTICDRLAASYEA